MKKILLAIMLLMPAMMWAQSFYQPSELRVELKVWDSEDDVNYLVENGKPVSWTYNYGAGNPIGFNMFATYCHGDKFITLSFKDNNRIYLCDQSSVTSFENYFGDMFGMLGYLPWFSGFKYSKIVYDIWWNRILIPVGTDQSTGQSYAISVYFNDNGSGSVQSVPADIPIDESNVSYYDLQGRRVDLDSTKGQVIIKTDGKNSIKIVNR